MITKGIVEEIINPYSIKVRIPFYNKIAAAPNATPSEELYVAAVCALPNSVMNYQVGDVVFIGFENHTTSKPIILGQLSREIGSANSAEVTVNSLTVNVDTYLSDLTTIGNVKPAEISYLQGVNKNLQFQLDILSERIAKLEEKLKEK